MQNLFNFTLVLSIVIVTLLAATVNANAISSNEGYSYLQKRTEVAHCYPTDGCQGQLLRSIDYGTYFKDGDCPYLVQEITATRCDTCTSRDGCHTVNKGGCGQGGSGCFHPI